ncbi:class I adenylate-forming enzyme family protein [Haliangium sp.]|uniref:class I adenylate-forming enzyme family protein n=1 Tax=Haliangium sp. TaxID=2663208 RepID=UPI003D147B7D
MSVRDHAAALSITAAAAEAPDRAGLVHRGQVFSFAALATRVRAFTARIPALAAALDLPGSGSIWPIVAEPALDTALALYTALDRGDTLVLLPPRASADEHRAFVERTRALAPDPGTARVVVFSSGTQGHDKGVIASARALVASATASATNLGWRDDDRWLCCLPLAHVGGLSILTRCLVARRTAVLAHGGFDPDRIAEVVERERITLLSLVPTMLARLLDHGWIAPPPLRAVLLGGAAASPALLARARERGLPVLLTYGMSETCAQICTQPYGTPPALDGRIGPALPGAELRIRDGRVQVRGPMLFDGYLGAPSPFDEDGWFDTGDRGQLDADGSLRVLGRSDDVIITGGKNVHPAEVEPALVAHPDITGACVFGLADPLWGHVIAAAVVCRRRPSDLAAWVAAVGEYLAPRLPTHRRPRRLAVVDALPVGPTGKVERRRVAAECGDALLPIDYPPTPTDSD